MRVQWGVMGELWVSHGHEREECHGRVMKSHEES